MMSLHNLFTIARYEMRTLMRSWFFRIFAGLSVLGLGIFNIAANIPQSGAPLMYRVLPASLPYTNLLILNLGQAIVAIFLASEFLKQDKKNDTVEVIYARSMTNGEYILGKALGVLSVFFFLNLAILILGTGFSFLSGDSAKGIVEYLYYPLLISLPTLVYILGLSFFLMVLLKNQAVTFIVLLGYIAISIFYLDTKFYHLFDYIAYQVPMMKSTIGGFGNLQEVLIHRGIYFFIGLGLVFFTVFKIDRLPQSRKMTSFPIYLTILSLAAGIYLINSYIDIKRGNETYTEHLLELNNSYAGYPRLTTDSCKLELTHSGEEIEVRATMSLSNQTKSKIDTIIVSLNPGLQITELQANGLRTDYYREEQILKIIPKKVVEPDENYLINIVYQGHIMEHTHFLDQSMDDYEDNFSFEMFRIRKRYAYILEDFVCLTSGALWYPISGVGYASDYPALHTPDFTNYDLTVHSRPDLQAISQGITDSIGPGSFHFKPEVALPQISLVIGDYINYSITSDSITYSIYTIDGNQFYVEHFEDFTDSLPGLIREIKNQYEAEIGFSYPFKRWSLVEVPLQFSLDKHIWSISSDAVQPEMTFYAEKGVVLEETDFRKRKEREERRMKRNNEEISEAELQTRIFRRFAEGNFMANHQEWYMHDDMDRNTLSLFPNYVTFITQMRSEQWPILNLSMQAYLKDRNANAVSSYRWFFQDLSDGERINLELKEASLEELLVSGIERAADKDNDDQIDINDVIIAKGDHLFTLLRARYGTEDFNDFLNELVDQHKHKTFSLLTFDSLLEARFGSSITGEIADWYSKNQQAGFLIKEMQTYKVLEDERTRYQIRFKIANPEASAGLVTINVDLNNPNDRRRRRGEDIVPDFSRKVYIPAHSAKEVGFVFPNEPTRMNIFTHISENLPNNIIYDFGSFHEIKKLATFDTIIDYPVFDHIIAVKEIIVDNEDEGFEYNQVLQKSYLKTLVDKNKKPGYKYEGIRYWSPPNEWKSVLRSGFYGKYVRSAAYTKSGQNDRTAIWTANLPNAGMYDVYCHVEKINVNRRRRRETRKSDYNFRVYHESGVDDIHRADSDLENGWNYLGTFFISSPTTRVELSNKSVGTMVFADAIKWVEND